MHLSHPGAWAAVRSEEMVLLLLNCCLFLLPLWESVVVLCFVRYIYVPSSFAIILMGKRGLVALLSLSSRCLVIVMWLFLAMPWVCLQFVIVVFPDHAHLLFFMKLYKISGSCGAQFLSRLFRTKKSIKLKDLELRYVLSLSYRPSDLCWARVIVP